TAMVNINSGATLKAFPNLGGADEVWFNKGDGHYFFPSCNTACRAGTGPEVLGVVDSSGRQGDQSVVLATQLGNATGRRAHSVAADPRTLQVYVPLPATTGTGGNDASMCTSAPKNVGSASATTGCILVLKATPDADDRVARERGNDDSQD